MSGCAHNAPPALTPTLLSRILSAPVPYKDPAEEKVCCEIIDCLSRTELESAARTSFAYHVASASSDGAIRSLATDDVRRRMAIRMARRHLEQKRLHGDAEKAVGSVRECLRFRRERDLDALRYCFRPRRSSANDGGESSVASEESGRCASLAVREDELPDLSAVSRYESLVVKDTSAQPILVRGLDVRDRAIVIKFPRVSPECDEEAYVLTHLYIAERAVAATEFFSEGKEEKLMVVLDFENYGESCRPPFRAMKRLVRELQDNYPERLDHCIIVEPPFWIRALFTVLRPFLDPDKKEKVVLVNGEQQRIDKVSPLVGTENAMPFLLPDGQLTSEVDMDHYLRVVSFFDSYRDKE